MLQRLAQVGQNRYVGAAVVGSIAGLMLLLFFLVIRGQRDTVVLQVQPLEDTANIHVYVGGDVANPGLYALPRGSRVSDAIDMAGGLLMSADASAIGMAAPLTDADQIIVPARVPTVPVASALPTSGPSSGSHNGAATSAPAAGTALPATPAQVVQTDGRIDINNAPAYELERLPGIGPAIAGRIVEYRLQHGPFQSFEELAGVSGISDRMVEELRPLISLGP